ncbi:hypothetical protein AX289_31665 [Methylorubrum populi]|nr:hypothetical protein AX289_31665 [Methylorubrum populi]
MRDISGDKSSLVGALADSSIVERNRLVAFVLEPETAFAANPFPSLTAGVARQRWGLREIEFEGMLVASAGLRCLMTALTALPSSEGMRQEILRSARHVLYVLRREEAGSLVGAVLYGKPGEALPSFRPPPPPVLVPTSASRRPRVTRSSRKARVEGQLSLFDLLTG